MLRQLTGGCLPPPLSYPGLWRAGAPRRVPCVPAQCINVLPCSSCCLSLHGVVYLFLSIHYGWGDVSGIPPCMCDCVEECDMYIYFSML